MFENLVRFEARVDNQTVAAIVETSNVRVFLKGTGYYYRDIEFRRGQDAFPCNEDFNSKERGKNNLGKRRGSYARQSVGHLTEAHGLATVATCQVRKLCSRIRNLFFSLFGVRETVVRRRQTTVKDPRASESGLFGVSAAWTFDRRCDNVSTGVWTVVASMSLIIPAYNEAERLPPYLASVRQHLDKRYPGAYEVIVVDDGSRDDLSNVLAPLAADWPELALMRHATNRGKGAAVRTGILAARGELLLFADADGATPIAEEIQLSDAVEAGADLAVGSRRAAGGDVTRTRKWPRSMLGRLFACSARWWLDISVRDTQCGFKMFRRDAGRRLFALVRESGYLFDLELLVLADRLGYRVAEVPVSWFEMPGGHLSLMRESGKILLGLCRLRRRLTGPNSPPTERQ